MRILIAFVLICCGLSCEYEMESCGKMCGSAGVKHFVSGQPGDCNARPAGPVCECNQKVMP